MNKKVTFKNNNYLRLAFIKLVRLCQKMELANIIVILIDTLGFLVVEKHFLVMTVTI